MLSKKKHITLSLEKKVSVIREVENGQSLRKVSKAFNIGKSTVGDILKKKDLIMKSYTDFKSNGVINRKTLKDCQYPNVEEALFLWFIQQRCVNNQLINEVLVEKAKWFYKEIHGSTLDFKPTNGWLKGFKERHGIKYLKMCGERLSSDSSCIEPFKVKFKNMFNEMKLELCQLYNADESALYWKKLPFKTLTGHTEKYAAGRKMQKDRITFMPCSNADGTNRLPLLVLGKSKNPRCFKNHKLPVCYASSKKGGVNRDLFQNWFYNELIPSVRKYSEENYIKPTALLMIDNAASHYNGMTSLESDDGLIKVLYLPPNCTALVQPMDQGVIYSTKSKYKRKFALSFLGDFSISYEQKLKQINLKDVVFWLAEAWNEVSNNIILHSWNVLLDGTEELSLHIEENINLSELLCKINPNHGEILTNDEINSWIVDTTAGNDLEIYTDEEILAEVLEKSTHTKTNYADETFQDIDSEDEDDYEKLILTSVISKNINQSETINQSQNGEARSDPIGLLNANEDTHQHNLLVKIDNLIEYCEDSKYDLKDIFNLRNIRQKNLQDIFNKY